MLKIKINETDGYKSEILELKSKKNDVAELKKIISERDDQILRLQSERNVFSREFNRIKLELERQTNGVKPDMILSEYSLNAKEKKNFERQQALEVQEAELLERQHKYVIHVVAHYTIKSSIVYQIFFGRKTL